MKKQWVKQYSVNNKLSLINVKLWGDTEKFSTQIRDSEIDSDVMPFDQFLGRLRSF